MSTISLPLLWFCCISKQTNGLMLTKTKNILFLTMTMRHLTYTRTDDNLKLIFPHKFHIFITVSGSIQITFTHTEWLMFVSLSPMCLPFGLLPHSLSEPLALCLLLLVIFMFKKPSSLSYTVV